MRIEQIKAFLTVVKTKNFQQAARECDTTQSTISRQIQALETELGTVLLHPSDRVKLTVTGELFLPRALKIDREWNLAREEILDLISGKQEELCVATIGSICSTYLPPVLASFVNKYPQVKLRVTTLGSDRAIKVLRDGLVDLAIVMQSTLFKTSPELVVDLLYEEPIFALLSSSHPLASYQYIPTAELIQYPQIIFKEGYAMHNLVKEQFDRWGAKLNAVLELNNIDAFRATIGQSNWLALLPLSALVDLDGDSSLTVRQLLQPMPMRQVLLVTTKDRLKIPPIRQFRNLALELIKPEIDLIVK
ncbi:MAG: LysR family transcriptional regulator [Prochloraceae cyanobacterium]